jgi:hypothetical protein
VFKDAASLYRDGPRALGVSDRFLGAYVDKYTQAVFIPESRDSDAAMVFVESNMALKGEDADYAAQRRKQLAFYMILRTDSLRPAGSQMATGQYFMEGFRKDIANVNRLWTDNAPGDREMIRTYLKIADCCRADNNVE